MNTKTETEKRGISFIPINEISAEARLKLKKLAEAKKNKLEKLVKDYNEEHGGGIQPVTN